MRARIGVPLAIALLIIACRQTTRSPNTPTGEERDTSPPAHQGIAGGVAMSRSPAEAPQQYLMLPAPIPSDASMAMPDSVAPAMLIRDGQVGIEVDSLDAGVAAVRALAQRLGGYVANTTMRVGRNETHTAILSLKIPSARFDEALTGLSPLGKLESVTITTRDVGEEYLDVSTRVANARRLEQRLVELLATRTGKLSDVLDVERELARVRGEIEGYEGRLRYLRTHATMSTLAVTVHEPFPLVGERGSGSVLAESVRAAGRNFVRFVAGFIAALGTAIPIGAILATIGFAVLRWRRRATLRRVPPPALAE